MLSNLLPKIPGITQPITSGGGPVSAFSDYLGPHDYGDTQLNQGFYGDGKVIIGGSENPDQSYIILGLIAAGAFLLFRKGKK